jgi:D-alanyl-D-alanine carboxypeptidase/D-alanyl-D-alanine carboxypeptidase (penicillin-binding protein 5/6)
MFRKRRKRTALKVVGLIGLFAVISAVVYAVFGIRSFALTVDSNEIPEPPTVSAKSSILIEAATGRVIFGKREYDKLPVASTTKILTTILMLESGNLDTEFLMGPEILVEGSTMGLLEGDLVSKLDLCYGMMLPSGNDAANATAYILGGGTAGFSELMNAKAAKIGMNDSHFVTPSGLHASNHYSTAYDMALLTRYALTNPDFAEICATESIKLDYDNPPYKRWLSNSNKLLSLYDGCIGVKTGFTDEAGRCLISAAERGGVKLICVTLDAPNDWSDHKNLLDYGFSIVKPIETAFDIGDIKASVVGGDSDNVDIKLSRNPLLTSINGEVPETVCRICLPTFSYAPVSSGQILGRAEFISGNAIVDTVDLVADCDVKIVTRKQPKPLYYIIIDLFKKYV